MTIALESRIYDVKTFYRFLVDMIYHWGDLKEAEKHERISKQFSERIMLSVTRVNGCRFCSYVHTKSALKAGMKEDDIKTLLMGDNENIPPEEGVAILFAQHYAEEKGHYDPETWKRVLDTYGEDAARDIMAFIRVMMVSTHHAIAFEGLFKRAKMKPDTGSSIGREIGIALGMFIFIPFIIIKKFFRPKRPA